MALDLEKIKPYRSLKQVDPLLWQTLAGADPDRVALRSGALRRGEGYSLELLGQTFSVQPRERTILGPDRRPATFQEGLVLLVYLTGDGPAGLAGERVPLRRLAGGDLFFTKEHVPSTDALAQEIGLDVETFRNVGLDLGGRPTGQGQASWLVMALPQLPLEAIFFIGDEEFPPRISLLVDAAAGNYLDLGTLWGLINLLARRIKEEAKAKAG
ncbi:MAG: DUF3786 domain-containing protein [Deltaproteobacteria bacterium]|nr:DUF3786 domain-containing protein [Deltaproteobacteria bacterium]